MGRKRILVIVHTVAYGKRLLDVLSLFEADFRVQVIFAAPPHAFGDEVPRFLERMGVVALPWEEVTKMTFDLALAAGPQRVGDVQAPLITIPHGANYLKRVLGVAGPNVAGLRRADLMPGGAPLPAAVVVPHHEDLDDLAGSCPEALDVARVVGDPAHDRILASLPRRDEYRQALGLSESQKLVVVTSTWGPQSSFGRLETLVPRLIGELPATRCRSAMLVHPNVWSGHGAWQVQAWLARCSQEGIGLVPPFTDWRSVLICADWIIGDHGSVTLYGTLTGAPILLASSPEQEINPASPAARLARTAPALSPAHSLTDQLAYASAEYLPEEYAAIAARITSEPGRFNRNMRKVMYGLLNLGQPAHAPITPVLPSPPPLDSWTTGGQENSA
ncbi:hypothetical protein CXR04_15385 [Streptomyces sp. CMB-StM0423]|nr:hypothetical protein CXR04_15385 [Streptomyces sp. CMB-StM0423]